MKAMILSAGYGSRMGELTKNRPKPLIEIGQYSLIEHNIAMVRAAGVRDICINLGYLGAQIRHKLGDGSAYGVKLMYTEEDPDRGLLGSGGGVKHALPQLGKEPFLLLSADIWTQFSVANLFPKVKRHRNIICVVDVGQQENELGDFAMTPSGEIQQLKMKKNVIFAGIGVFCPSYFERMQKKRFGLKAVINQSIEQRSCWGVRIDDLWENVGTPEQKHALEKRLGLIDK